MSLKYQVLDDTTALIGVLKLQDKQTGEMAESYIHFDKPPVKTLPTVKKAHEPEEVKAYRV